MTQHFFITGTDTEIGKTHVTCLLAKHHQSQGKSVACFKPLASGAERCNNDLINDDAEKLQQAASIHLPLKQINPYCFAPPIAPHIAAQQTGTNIDLNIIVNHIKAVDADIVLIEGFGGWLAPVSLARGNFLWQSDISRAVDAQVILVVGMRLGCLNHALLSVKQIQQDGLQLAGWIANIVDPEMANSKENIETLEQQIPHPLLNIIPWEPR